MLKRQSGKINVIRISPAIRNRSSELPKLESIWTSDEAAQYLRINPRTLTRMARAVSDEKRNAQSKVVKMLLPGTLTAVI